MKYFVPGLVVDLLWFVFRGGFDRYAIAVVVGATANAAKLTASYILGLLLGIPAGYLALGVGHRSHDARRVRRAGRAYRRVRAQKVAAGGHPELLAGREKRHRHETRPVDSLVLVVQLPSCCLAAPAVAQTWIEGAGGPTVQRRSDR